MPVCYLPEQQVYLTHEDIKEIERIIGKRLNYMVLPEPESGIVILADRDIPRQTYEAVDIVFDDLLKRLPVTYDDILMPSNEFIAKAASDSILNRNQFIRTNIIDNDIVIKTIPEKDIFKNYQRKVYNLEPETKMPKGFNESGNKSFDHITSKQRKGKR